MALRRHKDRKRSDPNPGIAAAHDEPRSDCEDLLSRERPGAGKDRKPGDRGACEKESKVQGSE